MISSEKHELELKTPRDFIKYINKVFTYNFTYEKIEFPTFRINRGNPLQVFEYVLASSQEEKTQSFLDVFNRVIECDFPEPINLFFAYYSAQTLEESVTSVHKLMLHYLQMEKLEDSGKRYKKAMKKIRRSYREKLSEKGDMITVEYDLSQSFKSLEISPYTAETFLLPDVVLNILTKYETTPHEDLSEYKNIIEHVFLNQGLFKMSDEHREYYLENFADLLATSSVNMKTYTANAHTLKKVSKGVYSTDKNTLVGKLAGKKRRCDSAKEYMSMYNNLEEFF
jgi:hypothetical protein